jgi:hypothetical protein
MVGIYGMRRTGWLAAALLLAALGVVLAVTVSSYALVVSAVASAALLGMALAPQGGAARGGRRARKVARARLVARARRRVPLADGSERAAIIVPVNGEQVYAYVLTADGHALVDAEGRLVHRLR